MVPEEANEEIRNKYLGSDFKLPESAKPYYDLCVDSKSISQLELTSENYNDIMKIKGMQSILSKVEIMEKVS